jgi:glycosyltransferase involved in cell wall biosynthesis
LYLFATHIPVYFEDERRYVDDSWHADLILARDFFSRHFGEIFVVGPGLPVEIAEGPIRNIVPQHDGITLIPSFDGRLRVRQYWRYGKAQFIRHLTPLAQTARVVHCGVDDALRPVQLTALRLAHRLRRPTVLVGPDMVPWEVLRTRRWRIPPGAFLREHLSAMLWEQSMRRQAARASVCMLKEGLAYDLYARYAANPRMFCHSMHRNSDVISEEALDARLQTLKTDRRLRFVYFGRLVPRKGIADSIRVVARLKDQGTNVFLDIYGEGTQRDELLHLIQALNIESSVHLKGFMSYGPQLLQCISKYDAVLFAPTEEDTPRMAYDAYACGLPLITSDIPFLKTRANSDQASMIFPVGDVQEASRIITQLDRCRDSLAQLSIRARCAGLRHSVESWYGKRTEWTIEAVERHESATRERRFKVVENESSVLQEGGRS